MGGRGGRGSRREPGIDYRARATTGVALAALPLLLPFVLVSVEDGRTIMAAGTVGIVAMLALNVWLVSRGHGYERLTLWGLVPGGMLFMIHVFLVDGIIGSVWCYPSILACYCMLEHRRALIANGIIVAVALPMMSLTLPLDTGARFAATLLAVSLFASILVREIDAMRRRLHYQIEHDPLTGLLNRTSLKERLEQAIDARRRSLERAVLLAVDLDHFKCINDRFGHDTGDAVLREIAHELRRAIRDGDAAFRIGGEEFLILLCGIDANAARLRAEELRERIERAAILQHHRVTASIGVAELRKSDDRGTWTRRADERLYEAKRAGRNRVVHAGDEPTDGALASSADRTLEAL